MTQPIEQEGSVEHLPAEETGPQYVRILRRVFGRHLMDLAILFLLPLILSGLSAREGVFADPDIWWHLANARFLWDTHHFIHIEPYSFTVAGAQWIDPEWFSEVPFWLGYKICGLLGVFSVAWLAVSLNVVAIYWRSWLICRNAGVSLWISVLGFVLMWVNAGLRTILFGYLALSLQLALLEMVERGRHRVLWLLPPLFCIWINLHGSWIIGLGLLVLYIACGAFNVDAGMFQQHRRSRDEQWRLLLVLAASILVLFLNPYGWRMVWNPFDMILNQKLNIANVIEWQPLNLSWMVGKATLCAIGLMFLANAIRGRSWKIYQIAFVFFAWYSAFDHARFTFLAAVITTPMLAADVSRTFFPFPNWKTIPLMNGLIAAAMITVTVWYFPTQQRLESGFPKQFPLRLIAKIQPSWRTLNDEHLGGIMDFSSKPTFIDTRWDTFEHHGVMKDYLSIFQIQDPLPLLDKYRIDHLLVHKTEPLAYVLQHGGGWVIQESESSGNDAYVLLVKAPVGSAK
jgi:hypothetical protein